MKNKKTRVLLVIGLLPCISKCCISADRVDLHSTTDNVYKITPNISINQKKFKKILDYEMKTRRNVFTSILTFLNHSFQCFVCYFLLVNENKKSEEHNPSELKLLQRKETIKQRDILIIIGFYSFLKIVINYLNFAIKNEEIKPQMEVTVYTYNSYKNALNVSQITNLQEKLTNNLTKEELTGLVLEFIDTTTLKKTFFFSLDPLRWALSIKISNKTKRNFEKLKNKSNEEIIEGIIKNYEFYTNEQLVNINWLLLIFNVVSLYLHIYLQYKQYKYYSKKFEENVFFYGNNFQRNFSYKKGKFYQWSQLVVACTQWTLLIPIVFSLLEFMQIRINKVYYKKFMKNL